MSARTAHCAREIYESTLSKLLPLLKLLGLGRAIRHTTRDTFRLPTQQLVRIGRSIDTVITSLTSNRPWGPSTAARNFAGAATQEYLRITPLVHTLEAHMSSHPIHMPLAWGQSRPRLYIDPIVMMTDRQG